MQSDNAENANKAASECLYTLEKFLKQFDGLRINQQKIINLGGEPPASYATAFEKAKSILLDLAIFLSDSSGRPHVGAPVISPQMTPIIKSEDDILKKLIDELEDAERALNQGREQSSESESWRQRFWNKLSKAFNSADIIIHSLEKFVPGLSFVGELLKQTKNWMPEKLP